jgi:predicted membrane protein
VWYLVGFGICAVLVAFLMVSGFLSAFASDSCELQSCYSTVANGSMIAVIAPALIFVISFVVAIVRMVQRHIAFWVPLAGAALCCVGFAIGLCLVRSTLQVF